MKAIQATPKEIRKVFNDSYIIPDFQRPYSWEKEQCETLWDDIVSFHATAPADGERYFLGNIVVNPAEGGKWSVVDGQQRLTTLLLLVKAFFKSAGTYTALEMVAVPDNGWTPQAVQDKHMEKVIRLNNFFGLE